MHMALRMNISAPVRSSDTAKLSKHAASLVDCTQKKFFFLGEVTHRKPATPKQKFFFECNLLDWSIRLSH